MKEIQRERERDAKHRNRFEDIFSSLFFFMLLFCFFFSLICVYCFFTVCLFFLFLSFFFSSSVFLLFFFLLSRCVKEYIGHLNTKYCIPSCFSTLHSPAQFVITGSEDGRILFWSVSNSQPFCTLTQGQTNKPIPSTQAGQQNATPLKKAAPVLCIAAHPQLPIVVSAAMEAPYAIVVWKHQINQNGNNNLHTNGNNKTN